jgi:hypothetical protein
MSWKIPSKPGNDKTGWKRGARGIDGAFDKDGREYMKTFDPKADARIYGPTTRGTRPDGAQQVMFSAAKDPGTIKNSDDDGTSHGYAGVDE